LSKRSTQTVLNKLSAWFNKKEETWALF